MRMFSFTTRLYPITDVRISGLSHAEQVARLSAGGATLIQLREKYLSPREFYGEAEAALRVAHSRGARLIINDRVDIALALHADGVHLGRDDLSPSLARRLLGEGALIGFSTHNVEQAHAAADMPVDYIAIGPIFSTATKADPDPVVGLDGLRRVREVIGGIPLVAIGGITAQNAPKVISAGADAVAVISALLTDPPWIPERTMDFQSGI
jgi:thiamine-phosphate pyrophosphorylase